LRRLVMWSLAVGAGCGVVQFSVGAAAGDTISMTLGVGNFVLSAFTALVLMHIDDITPDNP